MWDRIKSLFDDERGAVAIVAAITMPVAAGLVAVTVDYSNAIYIRSRAQDALDAAALAYMRTYLFQGEERVSKDAGIETFRANIDQEPWSVDLGPVREVGGDLKLTGSAQRQMTPFMLQLLGVNHLDLAVQSEVRVGIRALSTILVPDVSRSMQGRHLDAAKDAMVTFGETMFRLPRQFRDQLHMAVVPYAGSVNVAGMNRNMQDFLRGWRYASDGDRPYNHKHHYMDGNGCTASLLHQFEEHLHHSGGRPEFRVQEWVWQQVAIVERETYWDEDDDGNRVERTREHVRHEWQCVDLGIVRTQAWSGCLQTRRGEFNPAVTLRRDDVAPLPPSTHQSDGPHCPPGQSAARTGFHSANDFERYVRGLDNGFSTAHDIGLLWGARLMEPAWAGTLGVPNYPWNREDDFPKYLLFMSDGASVDVGYTFGDYVGRNRDEINRNVRDICNYLKSRGVTIFGIYYQRDVRPDGLETVRDCASRERFYAADITSVENVYNAIATEIVTDNLRISR